MSLKEYLWPPALIARKRAQAQTRRQNDLAARESYKQYLKEQEILEPSPEVVFCMNLTKWIKADLRDYPYYAGNPKYKNKIK